MGEFAAQESIVGMNLRAVACLPLLGIRTGGDSSEILGILYLDSTKAMHSLSGLDEKILNKLAVEAGNVLERVEMMKSIEQRKTLERDLALAEETQRSLLPREIPKLDTSEVERVLPPDAIRRRRLLRLSIDAGRRSSIRHSRRFGEGSRRHPCSVQ